MTRVFNSREEAAEELRRWLPEEDAVFWRDHGNDKQHFETDSPWFLMQLGMLNNQQWLMARDYEMPDCDDGGWDVGPDEWRLRRI